MQSPRERGASARPLLNMSLAMLLVGATAPLGELALADIPLFPLLALRLILAWAALGLAGRAGAAPPRLAARHWAVLAFQALCGVVVFNCCLWLGMETAGPAAAGIFTSATPAVMALFGALLFGERPGARALCGIVLTVCGVLASRSAPGAPWRPGAADLLLLAAVAGESLFLLALKWLPRELSPLDAARRVTGLGVAWVLPLALWQARGFDAARVGLAAWLAVAALGVLVTAGGYVLWFRGVAEARPSQAAAVTGLLPVSAVFSAWALTAHAPGAWQLAGCLAVAAGIRLASPRGG